ncbi:MAG: replisome organizer [Sphaerospermopsis sp.]|nr:replisome organizer [Sphaerospermopsis sp.]
MANKRMFSLDVIDTDSFLDMPVSARCLYYDLGMRADDDGFISPKKVIRLTNATDDDLRILISKKFVIPFDSGVIVITHWKQNNQLRGDRYKPTVYQVEFNRLSIDNNSYLLDTSVLHTIGSQNVIPTVATGKDRLGKDSKEIYKEKLSLFVEHFNSMFSPKRNFKPEPIEKLFKHWIGIYSLDEIKMASVLAKQDPWFKDKLTPTLMLRTKNSNGDCDYIGDLLNKYQGKYEL